MTDSTIRSQQLPVSLRYKAEFHLAAYAKAVWSRHHHLGHMHAFSRKQTWRLKVKAWSSFSGWQGYAASWDVRSPAWWLDGDPGHFPWWMGVTTQPNAAHASS